MDIKELQELFDKGYRQVSRKFRMISRIDISRIDYELWVIKQNWASHDKGQTQDWYRRCVSKDSLTLPDHEIMNVFSSLDDYRTIDARMELPLSDLDIETLTKVYKKSLNKID